MMPILFLLSCITRLAAVDYWLCLCLSVCLCSRDNGHVQMPIASLSDISGICASTASIYCTVCIMFLYNHYCFHAVLFTCSLVYIHSCLHPFLFTYITAAAGNLRPAGQIRPTKAYHPARHPAWQ